MEKGRVLIVCLLVLFMMLPMSIFAQGNQEKAEEVIEISMSTWLSLQEVSKDMMTEIVSKFEATHPNIKVNMIGVTFENQLQQSIIAASGKNLPDIIHLNPKWVVPLDAQNALADIQPLLTGAEYQDIQAGYIESGTIDGELNCVPLQNGSIVVLANKALLKQAGLPEAIPGTWDEFKEAVRKISALGEGIYGFGARTAKASNSAFWFMPILIGEGGTIEDSNGNINFNTPASVAAMDWLYEIGTKNMTPIGMGIPEVRTLFAQGKVGFIFDGPWMKGVMRSISGKGEAVDDEYIVGLMPEGTNGSRFTIGNDHVLAISKTSKNKEAAMEFIRFLTMDKEITQLHFQTMGAIPGYTSMLLDPLYQQDAYVKAFIDSAEFASANPSKNPKFTAVLEELAAGMQEVLLGGDPKTVTAKIDKNMKAIYQ